METINDAIMSGEDIQKWHNKKIKENNKSWAIIFILCLIMWISHSVIVQKRTDEKIQELKNERGITALQQMQIKALQTAVDSAVYINEIMSGSDKNK